MNKVFFGWYMVGAALLFRAFSSAVLVYGFTAFMTPIATTFGWGLAPIALASSLHGLETATLNPLVGTVADRWPARILIPVGICIVALGLICISQTTSLAMFFVGFLVVGLGGAIGTSIVPTTVIARWFKKNIGKASGIMGMGMPIGGLFVPLLVKAIDAYGWQNTLIYLAVGLLIVGIPLSFLFRNRPEDYGLLPDGKTQQGDVAISSAHDFDIGAKEGLKMQAFWYLGIAMMLLLGGKNSQSLHMMPYLTSLGMERSTAAVAVMTYSIVTLVLRLPFGVLADIFPKKHVMALAFVLSTAGLVIFELLNGSSSALIVLFAIIYGAGAAGTTTLEPPIIREYFGTKRFGTIWGLISVFSTIGMISGPPVAGWVFDTRGAYHPIWLIFAGLTMGGTILMLTIPPASRKLSPAAS